MEHITIDCPLAMFFVHGNLIRWIRGRFARIRRGQGRRRLRALILLLRSFGSGDGVSDQHRRDGLASLSSSAHPRGIRFDCAGFFARPAGQSARFFRAATHQSDRHSLRPRRRSSMSRRMKTPRQASLPRRQRTKRRRARRASAMSPRAPSAGDVPGEARSADVPFSHSTSGAP